MTTSSSYLILTFAFRLEDRLQNLKPTMAAGFVVMAVGTYIAVYLSSEPSVWSGPQERLIHFISAFPAVIYA